MFSHSSIRSRLCLLAIFVLTLAAAGGSGFAQEATDDAELRRQLAMGEKLLGKTPDRAAVLYFLAETHALLHEPYQAMTRLKECINAREGFDPSGDPVFRGMKFSPEFKHLTEMAQKDFPKATRAQLRFVTPEKDIVPEGLAYDPEQDVFYLSSLHLKKILRIPRQAPDRASDFIPADRYNLLPVLGIRVDPADDSVWSATWLDNGKTELLHFDKTGTLLGASPTRGKQAWVQRSGGDARRLRFCHGHGRESSLSLRSQIENISGAVLKQGHVSAERHRA